MFKYVFLLLFMSSAYATSYSQDPFQGNLPMDIKDLINERFKGNLPLVKTEAELELRSLLKDLKDAPLTPDLLKGCVTHKTCTGSGKERTCDSWEVCVSSD